MNNEKNKKLYMAISVIIIFILLIFIIITLKNIYGNSSKQIKESYDFLYELEKVDAISEMDRMSINEFQEIKKVSDFANVKYTIVNNNYVIELNDEYKVIGYFEQNVRKIYNVDKLTVKDCKEYAKKYLNKIYKGEVIFKEVKDKNLDENPFYTMVYYKMNNGYICYSNEIVIKINKYDGTLVGYSNYSGNDEKFLSNIYITEEDSKNIFNNYMKELGLEGEIVSNPKIGYFNIDGEANQICYIIIYKVIEKDNNVKFNDIVINAETGEIVKHIINIIELIDGEDIDK